MGKKKADISGGLLWPELIPGTLIKRYKRFLADVKLDSGEEVVAHCPNSGAMTSCCQSGQPVYLSYHDNPKRKLKYTWELIDMPTSLVGVNTLVPNRLVKKAIADGVVQELSGYENIRAEVKVGEHSRLDLLLSNFNSDSPDPEQDDSDQCYVEIKNCTLVSDGQASFPDAVTTRGRKHLLELQTLARAGKRCVMFFLVQRMDASAFSPADHIDPEYGQELRRAAENGVEIIVYDVQIDLKKIVLNRPVPFMIFR